MIRNILTEVDKKFGNYNCGICTATGNYIADEFPPERSSGRKKRTKAVSPPGNGRTEFEMMYFTKLYFCTSGVRNLAGIG